jgi:hypothetical protein
MRRPIFLAASMPATLRIGLAALALGAATSAFGAGSCDFQPSPASASFGAIDPRLVTTATFNVALQIKCTGGGVAVFSITGLNDTGPGSYRLKHNTVAGEYMAYTVSTAVTSAGSNTTLTLTGQLVATSYQNAYFGSYSDRLTVLVTP